MLYSSPSPKLIVYASRVLALKALAAGVFSVWSTTRIPADVLVNPSLRSLLENPHCKLTLGFAALSVLSAAVSHSIISRTVVGLELEDGGKTLAVDQPRLFSSGVKRVRVDADSARSLTAGNTLQGFRVLSGFGKTYRSFYIFPVEPHWTSKDPAALKRLLYKEFFRESEALAAIAAGESYAASTIELTHDIRGFGSFRPALYADPKLRGLGREGEPQGLLENGGSPTPNANTNSLVTTAIPKGLRREGGEVWADFVIPKAPTLEERRAFERSKKLGKAQKLPHPTLPDNILSRSP